MTSPMDADQLRIALAAARTAYEQAETSREQVVADAGGITGVRAMWTLGQIVEDRYGHVWAGTAENGP